MFSYDVKFLTSDDSIYLKNTEFKSLKYETKKKVDESIHDHGKRSYCERRGGVWWSTKPRQLRQLESKLREKNIVYSEWTTDSLCTLVFSSGVIAYITVKCSTLDMTHILFDRYCVGKLNGQMVTGVVLCKSLLLFTHTDKTGTLITFGKNIDSSLPIQISDRDPHLQIVNLGGSARRADRRVSSCETPSYVRILVWGATIIEPAPWSPVLEDHANLHLYQITGQQMTLLAYHQLENEVLFAELSHKYDHIVHIVEQTACHKNGVSLIWLRYEIPEGENKITKLSTLRENVTRVSLPAPARVARRSPCDSKLLVSCIDASVHVIHHSAGLTHSTRAGFIATDVRWAGELVVATEEAGRLQCFDRALSLLHHHTKCLDLTSYMRDAKRVQILSSLTLRGGPLILASFTGGPLTLLRITHARLISAWIRSYRTPNAVALLRALDWEEEGAECLNAISEIVRHALRKGALGESGEAVQSALGAYLAPGVPLPPSAAKYAPAVHDLARKFFHHLLRRGRIEKALSLAVDLAAWDLFVDARWAAKKHNLPQLVEEATTCAAHYARLDGPDSECSGSCSQCSSHSYSSSDDESSSSSKPAKNPPPLPRVPLPPHPSILTVPITQNEPFTTNSIRPNLHQYLERDTTIWGKNIPSRDDPYVNSMYKRDVKPTNPVQNGRWGSMDNVLNYQRPPKNSVNYEYAKATQSVLDILPRNQEDRIASHFKHLFQTELKEEASNDRYIANISSNSNFNGRYPQDKFWTAVKPERNKVKFSDTVTIAVVSEALTPNPALELAASLPLCAPHKYLAAFAPHPPAPQPAPPPAPAPHPPENAAQKIPKIKVVHFGMV
ncbi:WD repeat-containing and planar cell polarity effector protein fritz [Bicyclus anynana]|uniref:WD repeat-containing and planar cell polarity effector protein fritz n=1 Tax=Bicyclus anynana TaxID=110368 RepID=A0ABM3LK07_BICAN|nr:WD repeat-containing and planar cell polarity effector protein fritz [Bicyclus anynana]